jgi:hypothetical protein
LRSGDTPAAHIYAQMIHEIGIDRRILTVVTPSNVKGVMQRTIPWENGHQTR